MAQKGSKESQQKQQKKKINREPVPFRALLISIKLKYNLLSGGRDRVTESNEHHQFSFPKKRNTFHVLRISLIIYSAVHLRLFMLISHLNVKAMTQLDKQH